MKYIIKNNIDFMIELQSVIYKLKDGDTIEFECGTYNVDETYVSEVPLYVSNHSGDGIHKVFIFLFKQSNITIDCGSAKFMFNGIIMPFCFKNCSNIILKNATIDFLRPSLSQGLIKDITHDYIDIYFEDEYTYEIENKIFYFTLAGYKQEPWMWRVLEIDSKTKTYAYNSGDVPFGDGFLSDNAIEIGKQTVRFNTKIKNLLPIGNILVFSHGLRDNPGVHMLDCKDVLCENVVIHQTSGMGFLGQNTENIEIKSCKVIPSGDRYFSCHADATHFVCCQGEVVLRNCVFERQHDDPANVHGIYAKITKIVDEYSVIAMLVESQQKGVRLFDINDEASIVDYNNLLPKNKNSIKEVVYINSDYMLIKFKNQIGDATINDGIENLTKVCEFKMLNCHCSKNRARGPLITTPKKVIISGNYISAPGSGIKICGDMYDYFESGAVTDVTIEDNIFEDCCYVNNAGWGSSVIEIDTIIKQPKNVRFHKNIKIINNTFKTFGTRILSGHCIDKLIYSGNKVIKTNTYEDYAQGENPIQLNECDNVEIFD